MFFGKLNTFLARNLLSVCFLAAVVFSPVLPHQSIFSESVFSPLVLEIEPLLPPVILVEGVVSEVVVSEEDQIADSSLVLEEVTRSSLTFQKGKFFPLLGVAADQTSSVTPAFYLGDSSAKENGLSFYSVRKNCAEVSQMACPNPTNSSGADFYPHSKSSLFVLKSVAFQGLFGFLGICPNRRDLPSKDSSMPCESYPWKSMTMRSANDWKSLWQPVRTIFPLPSSISYSLIQRTSIPNLSTNLIPNTSDISSTWSNEMEGFPRTYWEEREVTLHWAKILQNQLKKRRINLSQNRTNLA